MKYLVTGGTGFLGRHVVWRLARARHEVIFTGRKTTSARVVSEQSKNPVQFIAVEHGSRRAGSALIDAAQGCDAVVHCAALSAPWGDRQAFFRSNVESTREVVNACRSGHVRRLVHISTPSLYFDFADRLNIRESEPLPPPVNEYARTKLAAERLIHDSAPPSTVILRPRALFGAWDDTLLPRLLRILSGGTAPLIHDGKALVDLTYVDNAVDAVMLAIEKERVMHVETYNIADGEPVVFAALLDEIACAFGLRVRARPVPYAAAYAVAALMELSARLLPGWEPPLTRYSLGVISFSQTLDLSRARAALGYVPKIGFDEGLRRTAAWWKSAKQGSV